MYYLFYICIPYIHVYLTTITYIFQVIAMYPSFPLPESSRRVSGTLFDWTMVEAGRSGDELSGAEDASKDMEDFEKKKLYLLVAQCIAYPFNAKFQIENTPPRTKLNTERFGRIKRILHLALEDYSKLEQMHSTRLSKQEQDVVKKQGFLDSVQWMLDIVFPRPEIKTICEEGGVRGCVSCSSLVQQ